MVDLTRDENGCLHARLLDAVEGRSGTVYADWLTGEGLDVKVTVKHAALDPFRGYANAIGALGFWKAVREVFSETRKQRCWFHYADLRIMPMWSRIPLRDRGLLLARSA